MTHPTDLDVAAWLRERIEDVASQRGWAIEASSNGARVRCGEGCEVEIVHSAPSVDADLACCQVHLVKDSTAITSTETFVLNENAGAAETARCVSLALKMAATSTEASDMTRLFNAFLRAAIKAIEQRDPTACGHAFRVAALTKKLAEIVDQKTTGNFAQVQYTPEALREIEIAALVHDFGKVNVREEVLVKAKKLYPPTLKVIRSRFDFVKRSIENDHLHRRLMMMEDGTPSEELAILDAACERAVSDIEDCWRIICSANEPAMLPAGDFAKIEEIANRTYFDLGGHRQPFLEGVEVESLVTARGSLTSEELDEIRAHAAHTIAFLQQIPWPKNLSSVPSIAGAHHEKLNGSGYPAKLQGDQIPLASRMMAVADIFDALTAADRPYKKAVSVEQALDILTMEAKDHHIDKDLLELFIENDVYRVTSDALDSGASH